MRETLMEKAAGYLDCAQNDVALANGVFSARPHPGPLTEGEGTSPSITWAEMAERATRERGGPIQVSAIYATREEMEEKSFVVHLAEVAVDSETGAIDVQRITTIDEVGPILNPMNVQGQLEGGLAQGLGFTLMEELPSEDGRITTVGLNDYKIPTICDMPPLRTVLITDGQGPGPFGAKAVSELTISSIAPAIANAVYDAVGVRITNLPITAEKVYRALHGEP
jgi:CO/xanthine dehydrogenase Mo-binding subunit